MDDYYRQAIDGIVNAILSNSLENGHYFTSSLRRIATWAIPFVDYAFQDMESKKTVAVLFCNDDVEESVYVKRVVKALNTFNAVIAAFDIQHMEESNYFKDTLRAERLLSLPIGIIVYDSSGKVAAIQKFTVPTNKAKERTVKEQKSYWCWWRDASHYEVATLLELSYKYDTEDGDIYTKFVYPEFFELMIEGKTKKWDGKPRIKSYSESSYKSEKQNYKIPMCQLGLWDVETGHITGKGMTLLDVVRTYGADSQDYFLCLAKLILLDGKHLDLVKDLEEFQKSNPAIIPDTSAEFFVLFDEYMMNKNSVGTRKPTAVKTGAKRAYVRDEPKLWNKLGILKTQAASRYFIPFVGIEFNWERINEILLSNVFGGADE